MKKILPAGAGCFFLLVMPLLASWLMMGSCANIIPPAGGPRDSLPPVLVQSLPKDSALNVRPKLITLTFNEYVSVNDIFQQLVVNPAMNTQPQVDYKLRNVTIKLKDSLLSNTTYSFQFGEAIRDVNENNIARNFSYTFSTGPRLDTGTYSGKVLLAASGKVDSTLLVVLHKDLSDTAIFQLKPPYYTKLNGKGEFKFSFLPKDSFQVFVVKSAFNKKYDDSTQLFAFLPRTILPGKGQTDTLYAYKALEPAAPASSAQPAVKAVTNKDDTRLRYSTSVENGRQDLLKPIQLRFPRKISKLDTAGIVLCDTLSRPISGVTLLTDTSGKVITLQYPLKEKQNFLLLLKKESIADSTGATLTKNDTLKIATKKQEDYGSIRIKFINLNLSKRPVLQLYEGDKFVDAFPITSNEWRKNLFYPGNFEMRILYDTNGNGKWDPGQYPGNKKLPEIVFLLPKELSVRSGWDNEMTIQL
ncbi:MAG: Ig-like domain-containing protein [Bacteroidota bacterium]